jgi:hypothetical protein
MSTRSPALEPLSHEKRAPGHDDVVWVLPANPRDRHVLVYGAELRMPLSERFAITGAANFLTPTATGTVDAFLGVAFYPGRSAMRQDRNAYAPIAASQTIPPSRSTCTGSAAAPGRY